MLHIADMFNSGNMHASLMTYPHGFPAKHGFGSLAPAHIQKTDN
jgi:hypothetical protein